VNNRLVLLRSLLVIAASAILTSCASINPKQVWRDEPFSLIEGDGDLVKIYHHQRGAVPMNEQDVFASVAAGDGSWYVVRRAQEIRSEPNAFTKQARMDSWYADFRADTAKYPRSQLVAFMLGVRIGDYQMQSKEFPMCIDTEESCAMRQLENGMAARMNELPPLGGDQQHLTRTLGRYTLYVKLLNNRVSFSRGSEEDRKLENFLVEAKRHPIAFGIARIENVEENSSHGRYVVNATLEGIILKTGEFAPHQTADYYWSGGTKLDLKL
jgi:hypothetical protein